MPVVALSLLGLKILISTLFSCAVAQVDGCWLLSVEDQVYASCKGIYGGQSGTGIGFL
jgi:hypothetical protein